MIGHGFIALFLSLLFVAAAEAQSLKIADRKGDKSFTAEQLLASPLARDVAIAKDAVYGNVQAKLFRIALKRPL